MSKYDALENTHVTDADANGVSYLIKNNTVLAKTGDMFLDADRQTLTLKRLDLQSMHFEVDGKLQEHQTAAFIEHRSGLRNIELINLLTSNSTFTLDWQVEPEYRQLVVSCTSFGIDWWICFQEGSDHNYKPNGVAVFTNPGSCDAVEELYDILSNRSEFRGRIGELDSHDCIDYNVFVSEFIQDYADSINADAYFEEDEEDEEADDDDDDEAGDDDDGTSDPFPPGGYHQAQR
jgi:hypothetical protein